MNPSSNETGLQLPAPVTAAEQLPAAAPNVAPSLQAQPEQAPSGAELAAPVPAAVPQAAQPLPAMPIPTATATPVNTAASAVNDVTATTDDTDLIEKEWVERAKRVIEQNRDNPFKQSEELTVVKADYMKKNYDKVIKLDR